MLASGLPQSDRISSLRLWAPRSHWGFRQTKYSFSQYLCRSWSETILLEKTLQNDTNGQVQKPVFSFLQLRRSFQPKLAQSSRELPNISNNFLDYCYVMLGHPIISSLVFLLIHSKLSLRIQNKQFILKVSKFQRFDPCSSSLIPT